MVAVNVQAFEIETRTRHGDAVRADVYLPKGRTGPVPVLLGASPYQKKLRHLPASPTFPFMEYGPMQLYLDEGLPTWRWMYGQKVGTDTYHHDAQCPSRLRLHERARSRPKRADAGSD